MPLVTIYVVLALTAGGTGNNWGAMLGASLILVLRFRPAGLLPERRPRIPISLTSIPSPESR